MNSVTITCPLSLEIRGKRYYLNLNNYRNWYYQTSNNLKKKFSDVLSPQLEGLSPIPGKYSITYKLYAPNNIRRDLRGVTTIVGKFVEDTLQEYKITVDDDVHHYPEAHDYYMGIDKENPRVEVVIEWDM